MRHRRCLPDKIDFAFSSGFAFAADVSLIFSSFTAVGLVENLSFRSHYYYYHYTTSPLVAFLFSNDGNGKYCGSGHQCCVPFLIQHASSTSFTFRVTAEGEGMKKCVCVCGWIIWCSFVSYLYFPSRYDRVCVFNSS